MNNLGGGLGGGLRRLTFQTMNFVDVVVAVTEVTAKASSKKPISFSLSRDHCASSPGYKENYVVSALFGMMVSIS